MRCAVVNCCNNNGGKASSCSFFAFPTDKAIRKKWISFCGRKILYPNTAYVCMHHFKADDFRNNLKYEMGFAKKRLLKDGVIPTINIKDFKNDELYEQRARRIERRENKKTVDMILKNHCSALATSQENNTLQPFEFIDTTTETIDITTNNIDEIAGHQAENERDFESLKVTLEALEKDILILMQENTGYEITIKTMRDKIENIDTVHKKEREEMEKYLDKVKFELGCIEEKLRVFLTEGQISKLKNGINVETWSEEDITKSISLYTLSPKIYKIMCKNHFPLPPVHILQSRI